MSKVLERVIHEQTMEFLHTHQTLIKFQSDFQKNYSRDFLPFLFDWKKISNGFDFGILNGMILIDLQNAFHAVDYNILTQKMH